MAKMTVKYLGNLRCKAIHENSGNRLTTDAPTDNNGKGEAFSPTDLLATSLATCMITVMGIAAEKKGIAFDHIDAGIEKVMASDPRRVSEVRITIRIEDKDYTEKEKAILESAAKNCPVAKSLSPDLKQDLTIQYV